MKRTIGLVAAMAAALLGAGKASALTLPFTEDFGANNASWEDGANNPATWQSAGGPDGGSYASVNFNYFGFSSPFGGGPVIFRANDNDNASGDAFVGDWMAGSVVMVSAWVYQTTPENLNFFMRVANGFNFPGAVLTSGNVVAPNTWTQIVFPIDPNSPLCIGETITCAAALTSVGNLQFGTDAPASLVGTNFSYALGIDKVTITAVPEPSQAMLLGSGLAGLAILGRRRRAS
jgi:hypothetical protein